MTKNNKLFKYFIIPFLSILFIYYFKFLNKKKDSYIYSVFDTSIIKKAAITKDSIYLKNYIYFLNSPHLSSKDFFYLLGDFTDATDFSFGTYDINDDNWLNKSSKEKKIIKNNIYEVIVLYSISDIFLKKDMFNDAQDFQNWFNKHFKFNVRLNDSDKIIIKRKLDSYK